VSLTSDVFDYLTTNGQGTNLFEGDYPDRPDDIVSIYQYAGLGPVAVHNRPAPTLEQPALQVLVRAKHYIDGLARAQTIWNLLGSIVNWQGTTAFYQGFRPLGSVAQLARDDSGRSIFVQNHYVIKESV
jgi:hypothetical protein